MIDYIGILTRAWLGTHAPLAGNTLAAGTAGGSAATPTTTVAATTNAASADQVVDNVQLFYANIKQVTAKFRQTVFNSTFGQSKTSEGMVRLKKPGKMRWDYLELKKGAKQADRKKSFISNGQQLYVVENDNKQVIKKNLQQDLMPVAVTFLYGKGNLKSEFNAEIDKASSYGEKGDIVLKLTPKQPSAQYKNLYLVVNPKDFHVRQSIIIDSSNNKNQFEFFEPNFEQDIPDSWFEFNPASVKNYRFVDADQQQQQGGAGANMPAPMPPDLPAVPAPKK